MPGEQGGPCAAGPMLTPGCRSPGRPRQLHGQGERLVGPWPTSRSHDAQLVTGSSLHWDGAFHAQFSSSAGYLQALTCSPALSPPFYRSKKPKLASCSRHHLALRTPFPKEAGLVPQQGQRDVRTMLGGDMGASSCGALCPNPPCCVLQVSSAPRHGNDCQLILHYFSDADQLLNCCK